MPVNLSIDERSCSRDTSLALLTKKNRDEFIIGCDREILVTTAYVRSMVPSVDGFFVVSQLVLFVFVVWVTVVELVDGCRNW